MLRTLLAGMGISSLGLLLAAGTTVRGSSEESVFVYCCAGFRPPIEAAAEKFTATYGTPIELTFAGSGCLIAQAELAGQGDLFIPGEEHYIQKAKERGIVKEIVPIAYLRPVIAVKKGNPKGVSSLADLGQPGLRVGLGDPKSVAVGLAAERWFRARLDERTVGRIEANTTTRAINVNELGNQLALGGIDAAIVWDVTIPLFPQLEGIDAAGSIDHRTTITGGVLEMSRSPELADRFLRYLTGPEGRQVLEDFGYEPVQNAAGRANRTTAVGP